MPLASTVKEGLRRIATNWRSYNVAKTAAYTAKVRETGTTFTNLGASGTVTFTLPQNASKGHNYTFVVQAEYPIAIDPGSAGAIYTNEAKGTDDVAIVSGNIGDSVTLECDGNNDWITTGKFGSWGLDEHSKRWVYEQNFNKRPLLNADILITNTDPTLAQMALIYSANTDWEVIGTNMTGALCTFSTRGGITLTTAGAGSDCAILQPQQDTAASGLVTADFSTDDEIYFRAVITTGGTITGDMIVRAGFLTTLADITDFAVGNDAEQACFRYEDGVASGVWQATSSDNGTDDTNNSSVTVALSTTYDLEVRVDSSRVPRFYINGILESTNDALGTGHDLIPFVGVAEPAGGGGAARAADVHYLKVAKTLNS